MRCQLSRKASTEGPVASSRPTGLEAGLTIAGPKASGAGFSGATVPVSSAGGGGGVDGEFAVAGLLITFVSADLAAGEALGAGVSGFWAAAFCVPALSPPRLAAFPPGAPLAVSA